MSKRKRDDDDGCAADIRAQQAERDYYRELTPDERNEYERELAHRITHSLAVPAVVLLTMRENGHGNLSVIVHCALPQEHHQALAEGIGNIMRRAAGDIAANLGKVQDGPVRIDSETAQRALRPTQPTRRKPKREVH